MSTSKIMKDTTREMVDLPDRGEALGMPYSDFPKELRTFEERRAYQLGVAHGKFVQRHRMNQSTRIVCPERQIVCVLIWRMRLARRVLRRGEQQICADAYLDVLRAYYAEAHNAAESARRILYCGIDAL